MRCLYCGKELALLKRWTSGGEFCSDSHRQQYQEEYNQLALNRLLQAKPRDPVDAPDKKAPESAPAPARKVENAPKPAALATPPEIPKTSKAPTPALTLEAAPIAQEPAAEPEPQIEQPAGAAQPEPPGEPAPAAAGFVLEMPLPASAEVRTMAAAQGGFDQPFSPQLPDRSIEAAESELVLAAHVTLSPSSRAMDYATRTGERGLEVREFGRSAPVFHFEARDFAATRETGIVEPSEDPMEILFFPHPPQASPPLWQAGIAPFTLGYEAGTLARVAFRTTGLEDNREDLDLMPVEPAEETLAGLAAMDVQKSHSAAEPPAPFSGPASSPAVPVISVRMAAPPPAIAKTPVFRPAFTSSTPPFPATSSSLATSTEKKGDPAFVTRPLPLTLHGLAAGRGKPVQVFQTGVGADLEIQAPRSNALPLRPMMTLGPAPAPKTEERGQPALLVKNEAQAEPKKPQPTRSDPRFNNGKGRKPELDTQEPAPVASTIAKEPAAAATKSPETKAIGAKSPESRPEPKLPEPLAKPYTPVDLGLPKLTLEQSGMSILARIGIAAAAILVVGGIAFFTLHGGGSTVVVAKGAQVVAGAPLAALDSGWITDWGAEPGVRREHDISVLRPSVNLSDYRIEFQAQIENKALGWVFRAKDGKNYYVGKLEIVTPGLEPVVDVVHFAVVNGQAQARSQTPLPMKVRLDTVYKVRFDALGDHFVTWVQDQKVDEWTDGRFKMGGVGLYSERGERISLAGGFNAVPLEIRR